MRERNEQIHNILHKHQNGEWLDTDVYDAIQDILKTVGGKLYKYQGFTSVHSLSNLHNRELYCSKPSKFNDPFDCRIGIDIEELSNSVVAPHGQILDEALRDYKAVFQKEKSLDLCSTTMKLGIQPLLENAEFCKLIEQCTQQSLSDAQVVSILQKFPNEVSLLINTLIEHTINQTGLAGDCITSELFSNIIRSLNANQLVTQLAEIDVVASFAKASGAQHEGDRISLTKQMLQNAQPEKSSELEKMDEQFYQLDEDLRNLTDQHFHVGCLSETHDNVLLWSHYGESHSGFCVEYDFSKFILKEEKFLIFPVIYSENRQQIPWYAAASKTDDVKKRSIYDFLLCMITKDTSWSYEKEWRILRSTNSQSEMVALPIVSSVYLGANCTQENKKRILEIAGAIQVPVRQMMVDRGMYKLHAIPL